MQDDTIDVNQGVDMPKKPSAWLTEKYTAPSGKIYQRYVLDEKGQRVPKDPNATPEQIEQVKVERKSTEEKAAELQAKKDRKMKNALTRAYKVRHGKKLVPSDIAKQMAELADRVKGGKGQLRCVEFDEKNSNFRIVLANLDNDWLLVHAQVKTNMDYEHKWFFFNPYNEAHIDFDYLAHIESKVGDKGLQWPDKSTAEKPVVPDVKMRKPRKPKAA
jgi:hypothetical protein